jgi:pyruvate/2-oxoglutarate dehydrogenase complex dihydrolipoamide acyltransferase (E2) component
MRHHATKAALRKAEAAGIDLDEIEGSGVDGVITVKDLRAVRR